MMACANTNGWMDYETKTRWFRFFKKYINAPVPSDKKHILLLDGHSSNLNADLIELAKENNVVVIQFPPHLTHCLQPLDSCYFKTLKCNIRKYKNKIQIKNQYDFIHMMETPLYLTSNPDIIQTSFRISGVWPLKFREECIISDNIQESNNFSSTQNDVFVQSTIDDENDLSLFEETESSQFLSQVLTVSSNSMSLVPNNESSADLVINNNGSIITTINQRDPSIDVLNNGIMKLYDQVIEVKELLLKKKTS